MPQNKLGNSYLNFIASHDGIGMRPVEGLLNKDAINKMFKRLKKNGGEFSFRKVQGKSKRYMKPILLYLTHFKKLIPILKESIIMQDIYVLMQ